MKTIYKYVLDTACNVVGAPKFFIQWNYRKEQ